MATDILPKTFAGLDAPGSYDAAPAPQRQPLLRRFYLSMIESRGRRAERELRRFLVDPSRQHWPQP
jgi:hypothetical protein